MRGYSYLSVLLFILCPVFGLFAAEPVREESGDLDIRALIFERATLKKERIAPDFALPDMHKEIVKLSSYKDKQPVLLLFWTTLCPLCGYELEIINDNYAAMKKDGVEVFAVDAGESLRTVSNFTQDYPIACRVLLDVDTRVAVSYGLVGVPTYVLIHKNGRIAFQGHYFPRKEYRRVIEKSKD